MLHAASRNDALPAAGGTIRVPSKTTIASGTVNITKNRVTLRCASRTTSTLQQAAPGSPLITVAGVKEFNVTGCNFVGAGPGAAAAGGNEAIILGSGTIHVHIANNNFSNWTSWAVLAKRCTDCWISKNEWSHSWGGLVLWQGGRTCIQ